MFRNVVFSCGLDFEGPPLLSLSLSRTFEDARREKNVVVAGFFVALVRIEPEERRRTTLEERQRCRSCVNVPIQTNNKN